MQFSEAQVASALCRKSFREFVKEFVDIVIPGFKWNWHIDVICASLQTIAERVFVGLPKEYDFVCNISPGSSKSTLFSILYPAWIWTRMPRARIVGASYGHLLALDLSRKTRDVINSEKYRLLFPEIKLREDQNSKTHFINTLGGERYSAGSDGTVQGKHYDFIIVDDPIDPRGVRSEAEVDNANYFIQHVLSGRKTDRLVSVTILVMQRLAPNDPTHLFLTKKRVRHLCLPATLEFPVVPEGLKKYYKNGLMDPTRLPQDFLDEERLPSGMTEWGYASQYGQQPQPTSGGKFKVQFIQPGLPPTKFKKVVRFWDRAASAVPTAASAKSRKRSFTVGVKMGLDAENLLWVLDVRRGQWDSFTREEVIKKTAKRDGPGVEIGLEQEPGSGGLDSVRATVVRLKGFRTRILVARGSKDVRADEFSVQVNAGAVRIPRAFHDGTNWTGWAKDYIAELKYWPGGTWKDQGDASGGACTMLATRAVRVGPLKRRDATVA